MPTGEEEFLGTLTVPVGTSVALWLTAVHSLSFAHRPSEVICHFPMISVQLYLRLLPFFIEHFAKVTYELQPQGITFQQNTIPDIEVPSKLS